MFAKLGRGDRLNAELQTRFFGIERITDIDNRGFFLVWVYESE